MNYRFKALPELYWGVAIAVSLVVLQALLTFDPAAIADWRTWALAILGASVRAGAGAAIDWIRRSMTEQQDALAEAIQAMTPEERRGLLDKLESLKTRSLT